MIGFGFPKTDKPFADVKKTFISACEDAGIEGLVWHDRPAGHLWHEVRRGGVNADDIAKLIGHEKYISRVSVMFAICQLAQAGQSC